MAYIKSLNIGSKRGFGKTPTRVVDCVEGHGFQGDAHAGDWHRQVSLLASERIKKLKDNCGKDFAVGVFGENITTEGIDLYELEVGSVLKIGDTMHIVTQVGIGHNSHKGGLKIDRTENTIDLFMITEGVFTRVVVGGTISVGDPILILLK